MIAREVDVDALAFGSIGQRGNDIEASVEIMGREGDDLGGQTFLKFTNEISQFSSDMALAITDELGIELSAPQREAIAKPITSVSTAFLAFQRGLDSFDRRDLTTAKGLFEEAFRKDSSFIDAQAYAFNTDILQTIFGNQGKHPAALFEAKSSELEALPKTGASNPTTRLNQLWWEWMYRWDWLQVENIYWETRRAGKLTADDLSLISNHYSLIRGELNESLRLIDEALEQDPERLFYKKDQIFRHNAHGNYDEALRLLESLLPTSKEELEMDPFQWIYIEKGQLDKAMAWAENIDNTDPNPFTTLSIATIYALRKQPNKAQQIMTALETRASEGEYLPRGWMAKGYGYQGNMQKALQWLQKGVEQSRGDFSMLTIRTADMLKLFSDQPAYWEVIRKMDFPPLPQDHPFYEVEQRIRYSEDSNEKEDGLKITTLTVLPFESAKEQDTFKWLSKTLHDALTRQLEPLEQLTIKPAGSNGADASVQGVFVTEEDKLYVSVSLENHLNQTKKSLLSEIYVASDILELQNKIAIAVANEIRIFCSCGYGIFCSSIRAMTRHSAVFNWPCLKLLTAALRFRMLWRKSIPSWGTRRQRSRSTPVSRPKTPRTLIACATMHSVIRHSVITRWPFSLRRRRAQFPTIIRQPWLSKRKCSPRWGNRLKHESCWSKWISFAKTCPSHTTGVHEC